MSPIKSFCVLLIIAALPCIVRAQVAIDKPIQLTGPDGQRVVTYLELPVDPTDAANKAYVDAAVSAGGGGSAEPAEVSAESSALTFSAAMSHCRNLTDGGNLDWRLPTLGELLYFAGYDPSTNFLWTKTESPGLDFPINQNFISMRLSDGKWRNGGTSTFLFPTKNITNVSTYNTTWTTIGTIFPTNMVNTILPTHIRLMAQRVGSSGYPIYFRLVFNLADGSTAISSEYTTTSSTSQTFIDMQSIPLFNGGTPLSSIEVQGYTSNALAGAYVNSLAIGGYESAFNQRDGNTLHVRCVR